MAELPLQDDLNFCSALREIQDGRRPFPRALEIVIGMGEPPAGVNAEVVKHVHHVRYIDAMNDPGVLGESIRALMAYRRLDS